MSYDKVITNENCEEFPYSESFDSESYYYKISIVLDDRDANYSFLSGVLILSLMTMVAGWILKTAPNELFPKQIKLTHDNIFFYMQTILERESEAKLLTKQEVEKHYKNYLKQLNKF